MCRKYWHVDVVSVGFDTLLCLSQFIFFHEKEMAYELSTPYILLGLGVAAALGFAVIKMMKPAGPPPPSADVCEEFLKLHAQKAGVHKLKSGMLVEILKKGPMTGQSPSISDNCKVHYAGTLINGTQFDSSYDRGQPASFRPCDVVKGWTEALQLMHEGDKWRIVLPHTLAYGPRGAGGVIPGYSALIFEMELLEVWGRGCPAEVSVKELEKQTGTTYDKM